MDAARSLRCEQRTSGDHEGPPSRAMYGNAPVAARHGESPASALDVGLVVQLIPDRGSEKSAIQDRERGGTENGRFPAIAAPNRCTSACARERPVVFRVSPPESGHFGRVRIQVGKKPKKRGMQSQIEILNLSSASDWLNSLEAPAAALRISLFSRGSQSEEFATQSKIETGFVLIIGGAITDTVQGGISLVEGEHELHGLLYDGCVVCSAHGTLLVGVDQSSSVVSWIAPLSDFRASSMFPSRRYLRARSILLRTMVTRLRSGSSRERGCCGSVSGVDAWVSRPRPECLVELSGGVLDGPEAGRPLQIQMLVKNRLQA